MASVKDGVVTAQKEGTATVTVMTSNKKTASCAVTVTKAVVQNPVEVPVRSVKLNKTKLTLGLKEKFALKATVAPKQATAKALTFGSSSRKVASVDQKGAVTAKKTGKALITVKAGGKTATCAVTVKAAPKKISLNARTKTLKKGKTFQIKVKLPKNAASHQITYKTSKKKVATVSPAGKVKAVRRGTATITVKSFNKKSAKLKVKVT